MQMHEAINDSLIETYEQCIYHYISIYIYIYAYYCYNNYYQKQCYKTMRVI